jgi:hypothetical protein
MSMSMTNEIFWLILAKTNIIDVCNCSFGFYVFKQPEVDQVMFDKMQLHIYIVQLVVLTLINNYCVLCTTQWDVQDRNEIKGHL